VSLLPTKGVKEDEETQGLAYPKVFSDSAGRVGVNFGLGKLAYIYPDYGLGKTVRQILAKQEH